jgi:hypothetical protein
MKTNLKISRFDFEKYEKIKRLNNGRTYLNLSLVCSVFGLVLTIGNLKFNIINIFLIVIEITLKEIIKLKIKNLDKEKFDEK